MKARQNCKTQSREGRADLQSFRGRYYDYLESSHWHSLRNRKFEQWGRCCANCATDQNLRVHHIRYGKLTDVTLSDLMVLCEPCHNLLHKVIKINKLNRNTVTESNVRRVLAAYPIGNVVCVLKPRVGRRRMTLAERRERRKPRLVMRHIRHLIARFDANQPTT